MVTELTLINSSFVDERGEESVADFPTPWRSPPPIDRRL